MRRSRAFSLVEVVAVAAIASVVIALLVFVLRPSRGKGLEAHFRAELQQLCAAVNMYMGDYDDRYPLSLRALKKHLPESPTKPTGLKKALPGCYSSVYYNFTRNIAFLKGEARYNAQYPFDVRVDPVIKAPFFCKTTGTIEDRMFLDGDGKPFTKRREAWVQLGVRLDGYAGWFPEGAKWEEEFANKAHR